MSQPEVALWYWYHFAITYEIYRDERQAADAAVWKEDDAAGVPVGVQFPDGRTLRMDDWPEYREARERSRARDEAARTTPPRPTRKIRDPFEGHTVTVDADEPGWLGKHA